jgi:muramoyltetrapeptide carboxypeptidase
LGFSDVTFLLNALVEKAGLVAFHGPMVAMDLARGVTPRSLSHLKDVLEGRIFPLRLEAQETLRAGVAEGLLIGGCLSVLVAMLGTPYAPSFEGKILLLEDVGEKPYRIDRMLTQLRQSGAFANVAGVVFGGMSGVDNDAQEKRLIRRFIQEQVCTLGVPVIAGLNVGHRTENLTVPLGVRVRLDADNCELCVVEPWVM